MQLQTIDDSPPVLKVGAVILRAGDAQLLIIQPKPKHAGEVPPFVLPRGSRQYSVEGADGTVAWHDARDAATGAAHAPTLEPFTRALAREIHEEAGLTPEHLTQARVMELGARDFASRSKGVYAIHWFIVLPDRGGQEAMARDVPVDTLQTRWVTFPQVEAMAAAGEFSAGYVPVIREAIAMYAALTAV